MMGKGKLILQLQLCCLTYPVYVVSCNITTTSKKTILIRPINVEIFLLTKNFKILSQKTVLEWLHCLFIIIIPFISLTSIDRVSEKLLLQWTDKLFTNYITSHFTLSTLRFFFSLFFSISNFRNLLFMDNFIFFKCPHSVDAIHKVDSLSYSIRFTGIDVPNERRRRKKLVLPVPIAWTEFFFEIYKKKCFSKHS